MNGQLRSTEESYIRGILYEYTKVLTGEMTSFSSAVLGKKSASNAKNAQIICKQAFEVFLHWSPEDVAHRLTKDILIELKLMDVLPFLGLPDDYFSDNTLVINTYKMVLLGKENGGMYRFPKKYFDGNIGLARAYICLRYLISNYIFFHSVREMYEFFSTSAGTHFINAHGLKLVLRDVFHSPVRFLHEALYSEEKDEFWYHYYEFLYQYNKDKKLFDSYKKAEK